MGDPSTWSRPDRLFPAAADFLLHASAVNSVRPDGAEDCKLLDTARGRCSHAGRGFSRRGAFLGERDVLGRPRTQALLMCRSDYGWFYADRGTCRGGDRTIPERRTS